MTEPTHNSLAGFSKEEVREELARILASAQFLRSDRLARFLRFTVESMIDGRGDELKEYLIGTEVYDRKPPYNPGIDSIVRTEARRLRAKLKDYYESEGKSDPLFIYFRPGSYAPLLRKNRIAHAADPNHQPISSDLLTEGVGVSVAVLPFVDLSDQPLATAFARTLTEELTHVLTNAEGIRVVSKTAVAQLLSDTVDAANAAKQMGLHGIIEGSVVLENGHIRLTIKNSSPEGFQLCSHRFITEAKTELLSHVQQQIATAFVSRARPEQSHIRRSKASAGALTLAVYPHVIQAESMLDDGSALDIQSALLKFEDAARMAPGFARSFCGICMCQIELALRGAKPSTLVVSRAKAAAKRALELDPNMIESHSSMGCAQALEWDWKAAEKSFQRATELGIHAGSSRQFAMVLTALGRLDEASHRLELAQRIDPFSSRQKTARAKFLYLSRQFEEGAAMASEPEIYGPLPVEARFHSALMFALLRKTECAVRIAECLRADAAAQLGLMAGLAEVFALAGARKRAERIVSDYSLLDQSGGISRFRQAALALALGHTRQSLSLLSKALKDKEAEMVWIDVDPRFDAIRDERDFARIKKAVFAEIPARISHAVA